ncbi:1-deoxy-D-xylulose-5-phosphate synthase [Tepidibacter formicigenes]|jgi:1-deoxy-D-xylulose-5-phosphate synthase|uniref:1-deoxy-D-xylulose-5-phosphate synthase n=1 Tax=Tepidibacter formicigenes DSM 15518 TaxID=1123349 RepID=A0A1M6L1Y5_9FIRM|nr:1-deoxy-D-xylulose-5-phosphate synthase [Tepidibacter formicigenes]SHJ65285.1 1-deoxy-D-xylulose-5-phosphate synthase [Tepidibacter formicigenes DSM 15518]
MYKYLYNVNDPEDLKKLDINELDILANEIRKFLVKSISKTGGHLASNLGIVELTLALHYIFKSPKDKIVWDVGHQAYVHKIITGRRDKFDTLRKFEGLSGFPKRCESSHDIFETGHSSTSISAGLGLAMARDINKESHSIISIIGDGALTGGMAFEALNHLGHTKTNMIVVLNDNEMSIDENVGSLSNYLLKLRTNKAYKKIKDEFENITNIIPKIGNTVYKAADKFKDSVKYFMSEGILFEEMGIKYFGPIDGHDINELIETFNKIKNVKGPVLVHVVTKKGKGYRFAENEPNKYHGVSPFNVEKGIEKSTKESYSEVVGNKLVSLAKKNKKIVAITAAMPSGTGLNKFKEAYPDRFFDVGIAEGHAVTFAAGLAANGIRPYFAVYSTFLQRGYDQIIHDVALQNLPVTFLLDRAGLVGADGETHHGVFDLSYLNSIPNLTVMAPKDKLELEKMIEFSFEIDGPVAIRYPRGEAIKLKNENFDFKLGKWELLNQGENTAIIAIGNVVKNSLEAADTLKEKGVSPTVINGRFLKPMDEDILKDLSQKYKYIFTVEDNVLTGGFGEKITSVLSSFGFKGKIVNIALPDIFIEHGSVDILYNKYGLSSEKIANRVLNELNIER